MGALLLAPLRSARSVAGLASANAVGVEADGGDGVEHHVGHDGGAESSAAYDGDAEEPAEDGEAEHEGHGRSCGRALVVGEAEERTGDANGGDLGEVAGQAPLEQAAE